MRWLKFLVGALIWHLRAGLWYCGLGFRLYFAIGLDRSVHPGEEHDWGRHFRCPIPRTYREHLTA